MTPITARRITTTAILCAIGIAASPAAAFAEDPPSGEKLCEVTDPALNELSGLAANGDGFYAIVDGSLDQTQLVIYELDASCAIVNTITSFQDPNDPEDLAVDADGAIWVSDTGNNAWDRTSIALHKVDPATAETEVYRFTYPEGKVHDTEAILFAPDGMPIFATKDPGSSTLYRPTASLDQALNPDSPLPLEAIGSVAIAATETSGGPVELGSVSSTVITGGAVSADGSKAVLRTYTDAYEWQVTDGDVVAALTEGEPVVTPLPDEPQGEAITYTADGSFVTASEAVVDNATGAVVSNATLWTYQPTAPPPPPEEKEKDAPGKGFLGTMLDTLGVNGILWVIAGIGFIGFIIFLIGLRAILKARKDRAKKADDDHLESRSLAPDDPYRHDDGFIDGHDGRRDAYRDDVDGHDGRRDDYRDDYDRPRDDYRDYDDEPRGDYRDREYDDRPRDDYDRYDDPHERFSEDGHGRSQPPVPRQYPDDGLGNGRLFEKPGTVDPRDHDDYRDPRHHDDGNTGTVYGGSR